MNNTILFYRPMQIETECFYAKVDEIFKKRWFSNAGEKVLELESAIASEHNVKHCIAVCNATIGLQIVLKALNLSGEIITTPFTFAATAHAVQWLGLTPVFCDVDPKTLTIAPERIIEKITPRTSGILGVHVFGQTCDVVEIGKIAKRNDLTVVYDAAHSFMTSCRGVSVGNFGEAEVLSFHATKIFHTFEGGAILTNNPTLAGKLRALKNFGFDGMDSIGSLGINAKMNEVSAAFGLSLLPHMRKTIDRLMSIQSYYRTLLNGVGGVSFFDLSTEIDSNGSYVVVFIDKDELGINRDQLWAYLWDNGIQTRRYFYPCIHKSGPFSKTDCVMPEAENVAGRVLCLPCYYDLGDEDIKRVCELIKVASKKSDRIISWYKNLLVSDSCSDNMKCIHEVLK